MIRRSGVSSATYRSKAARDTLRFAASGHMPSTQLRKLTAAARMALACISGWPDAPDSPDHSRGVGLGVTAGVCDGVDPVVPDDDENSERTSNCAADGPAIAAIATA